MAVHNQHRAKREPHPAPFFLPYAVVAAILATTRSSSQTWHYAVAPTFIWVVVPLLDSCLSRAHTAHTHTRQLSVERRRELAESPWFRTAVLLWPLGQACVLWQSLRRARDLSIAAHAATTTRGDAANLALRVLLLLSSCTLVSAGGINAAHELLHKPSRTSRLFARALLVASCYGHFYIEHARGHHRRVATRDDPATMRKGESFYAFLPRTVVGGCLSAWRLECERLTKSALPVWSIHNEMLWYAVMPTAALFWPIARWYGAAAVAFYALQAAGAVVLLEQVNAIEHYGLERLHTADGTLEPVGPQHSWDAPHSIANYFMFKLQRHADHHMNAAKPYQLLDATPESPQLPAGYLTLAPCLLVPPLWRAIMHPVLDDYRARTPRT